MIRQLKIQLKKELAKDPGAAIVRIEEVLRVESPLYNDFILLQSRHNGVSANFNRGVLSEADYQLASNQIRAAFLSIIDRIETGDVDLKAETPVAAKRVEYSPEHFPWMSREPFFLETFDFPGGPSEVFEDFSEEIWTGSRDKGVFKLVNNTDPGAVKYHYLNIDDKDMAPFPATLEVRMESGDHFPRAAIGLLFCFDRNTRFYYAFIINNDREYKLWRRGASGYQTLVSGRSPLILPQEFNKVGFIRSNEQIYLFINDQCVKIVKDNTLQSGDSGIIAVGQGIFLFDNLSFFETMRQ